MALELLWACCSLWKTHVQISYFIPRRPLAGVLPAVIAQICLKHLWIISIWLIIHGPACWATVNKVTLFFIWLLSGSHVSRERNDPSGWGDHRSNASFCSEHRFGPFFVTFYPRRCRSPPRFRIGVVSAVQLFQGHHSDASFPVRCQRSITDTSPCVRSSIQPGLGGTDPCQLFAAPLVDPSAIDPRVAGQSIFGSTRLSSYG